MSSLPSVQLFGINIHRLTMDEAVAVLAEWMHAPSDAKSCRYVVTPNVDHIVTLQKSAAMQSAYRDAAMVVADGWPVVTASRWLGQPLPQRIAGSDLVPRLFEHFSNASAMGGWGEAQRPPSALGARCARPQPPDEAGSERRELRVYLLGAAPGVAAIAAEQIQNRWPGVSVCGVASPAPGFETDAAACEAIVAKINAHQPDLLVVGFGAPKQEVWLQQYAPRLHARVAIAAGATIDFLAGRQRRAPRWLQRCNLEWLYRAATNPRRLALRYAVDAAVFPQLFAKEWWRTRKPRLSTSRAETAHR